MLIAGSFSSHSLSSFSIFFNSVPIPQLSSIKIHFDFSWSFNKNVSVKLHFSVSDFFILSATQKLLISQLLIISLFDYANVVYIPALTQKPSRIQNIQNSCLRFSYNARKFDHLSVLIYSIPLAQNSSAFHSSFCYLVYRLVPILLPICVIFYTLNFGLYSQDTRFDSLSFLIHHSTKFRIAFSYIAVKFYSSSSPIHSSSSFPSFPSHILFFTER